METYPIYFWIVLLSKIKTFFSKMFDFHDGLDKSKMDKENISLL